MTVCGSQMCILAIIWTPAQIWGWINDRDLQNANSLRTLDPEICMKFAIAKFVYRIYHTQCPK